MQGKIKAPKHQYRVYIHCQGKKWYSRGSIFLLSKVQLIVMYPPEFTMEPRGTNKYCQKRDRNGPDCHKDLFCLHLRVQTIAQLL